MHNHKESLQHTFTISLSNRNIWDFQVNLLTHANKYLGLLKFVECKPFVYALNFPCKIFIPCVQVNGSLFSDK